MGLILSGLTIISTLLIGGATFGDLRNSTKTNTVKIKEFEHWEEQFRKESMENMKIVSKMSSDIEWIKTTLQQQRGN